MTTAPNTTSTLAPSAPRLRASIIGASGYTGGELLRLLLDHPHITLAHASSRRNAGTPLDVVHPHLRRRTELEFCTPDSVQPCDVLFLCMPHGEAATQIDRWASLAPLIIDLSADFRLRDLDAFQTWYGQAHPAPGWTEKFIYGLPETRRELLRRARYVSGVGCNATAMNLALLPLARAGLIRHAVCDLKVGSSEAGAEPSHSGHHPERVGRVRPFALTRHRHQAEVRQELGEFDLDVTVTSVELVRGVQCTAHIFPTQPLTDRDLWKLYRSAYASEPFVRLVKGREGLHRFPEPKLLSGTNYCDVGFEASADGRRLVIVSALDNLVKGAAGSAIQCMNITQGFDEAAGLTFQGLHPL